jgi:hypothetical protein
MEAVMADEREGAEVKSKAKGKIQTPGRQANAARPLSQADKAQGAPQAPNAGRLGPAADPVEGKR